MPVLGQDEAYSESYPALKARLAKSCDEIMTYLTHPDRVTDHDVTKLNLMKEKYVKDVKTKTDEEYKFYESVMEIIRNHIRKEFRMKVRATGEEVLVQEKIPARKKYLVIHFSECFEVPRRFYYPAEFALAEFSIFNGLGDGISGLIDIGKIPLGFDGRVRERRKKTCNPHPPFDPNFDPYEDALKLIEDFCSQHFKEDEKVLLFTPKEYIPIVSHGLEWLIEETKTKRPDYKAMDYCLLPFSCLLQALINEASNHNGLNDQENAIVIYHESNLDNILTDMTYGYAPELACEYHSLEENEAGVQYCSENVVKRLIYNATAPLSECWKFKPRSTSHWPQYLQTIGNVTRSKGFKIREVPRTSRYIGVPRFGGSDTMSVRMGLTSGSSSSGSGSIMSSASSTISEDGSEIRVRQLDRDPSYEWTEKDLRRQLRASSNRTCVSSETASDFSSSTRTPTSLIYLDRRPTYKEAEQQYSRDGKALSGPPVKVVGRGSGRGSSRATKYNSEILARESPLSCLPEEPGQFDDVAEGGPTLAKSNVEKLAHDFKKASLGSGSIVSTVSSEQTSLKSLGRGRSRWFGSSRSSSALSDSLDPESSHEQFVGFGRTHMLARSSVTSPSTEGGSTTTGYCFSPNEMEADQMDPDIDSITVVAMRHRHGSQHTDEDEDTGDDA